jgi:invasion protein IalB
MRREIFGIIAALATITIIVQGCSGPAAVSSEALGKAVREVGLSCDTVERAVPLNEQHTSWRVACTQAQTYVASVKGNGGICIAPLPMGDDLPGPIISPKARCTA